MGTFGARGGDVRDLDRARDLHAIHKAEWRAAVAARIRRAFHEQATVHADDLDDIGLPAEHRNMVGAQLGALVASGAIEEIGRRKSENPARRGAKSSVYRLTADGRARLLVGAGGTNREGTADGNDAPSTGRAGRIPATTSGARSASAAGPGETGLGVTGTAGTVAAPTGAGDPEPEQLPLVDMSTGAHRRARYEDWDAA